MKPEKLRYLEALANDLDSRGEIASAGMVRGLLAERNNLLAACRQAYEFLEDNPDYPNEQAAHRACEIAINAAAK